MTAIGDIDLGALDAYIQSTVDRGESPAAQYALAHHGRLVATRSFGTALPESRFCIFSSSKPIFASLVLRLVAEGLLGLDAPVVEYWPEFGRGGKRGITVRELLLFTAGIPTRWPEASTVHDRAARASQIAEWTTEFEPGTAYAYHAVSAHWVLAELVSRVTGQDHGDALALRVLLPLGLDRMTLGGPPSEIDALEVTPVGEFRPEVAAALRGAPVTSDELAEAAAPIIAIATNPRLLSTGVPGAGILSDAASVALFYQELLHNSHGLWPAELLDRATAAVENSLPDASRCGVPASRTIGCLLVSGADRPRIRIPALGVDITARPWGDAVSTRTFGHPGFGGQIAFADPDRGISFAFFTTGVQRDPVAGADREARILEHLIAAVDLTASATRRP